ncbi:MYND-type zinc finger protein samB [Smittium mucronatum]|uniref:MYND-type zinc finger protein samB n=1 Tax=Smittium mucronatum TaxID=133383 RepID=A0A1R0H1J0_9FUNG|nr:MYND-type zinc finger protein samB [Smittium mucronatum]
MRESNFNFPLTNKACVAISSALYDRRALDCTAILPLVNSLWNLGHLTLSSNRIREILTTDGGLERLVRILKTSKISQDSKDSYQTWKWLMAYHCIINMGIRGSQEVRTRVVQAGAISIIINILEAYLKKMKVIEIGRLINQIKNIAGGTGVIHKDDFPFRSDQVVNQLVDPVIDSQVNASNVFDSRAPALINDALRNRDGEVSLNSSQLYDQTGGIPSTRQPVGSNNVDSSRQNFNNSNNFHEQILTSSNDSMPASSFSSDGQGNVSGIPRLSTFIGNRLVNSTTLSIHPFEQNRLEILQMEFDQAQRELQLIENVMFRPEDVVLSLQLLAYVSKYPEVRSLLHSISVGQSSLHSSDGPNSRRVVDVFSIAEKFTSSNNLDYMQGWANIIMGNMCRRDERNGGIRKCANIHCQEWETPTRKFSKCKACRKAKYCSKECQSKSWSSGHRNWCVERQRSNDSSESVCPAVHPLPLSRESVAPVSPAAPASSHFSVSHNSNVRSSRLYRASTQMPYQTDRNARHNNNRQRESPSNPIRPRTRNCTNSNLSVSSNSSRPTPRNHTDLNSTSVGSRPSDTPHSLPPVRLNPIPSGRIISLPSINYSGRANSNGTNNHILNRTRNTENNNNRPVVSLDYRGDLQAETDRNSTPARSNLIDSNIPNQFNSNTFNPQ